MGAASLIRRFPWVASTLAVAALAGVIAVTPWGDAGVVLVGYVILMAARSAWAMVRELRHGTFGSTQ